MLAPGKFLVVEGGMAMVVVTVDKSTIINSLGSDHIRDRFPHPSCAELHPL